MAPLPAKAVAAPPGVILERGQTIDRFVVLGLVGRGGMGDVYAAYDPELDRKVAIKLLRARGDTGEGRTRLLREAQATAKLQHPNVVVVYDVGTFGENVFIAMEFVEGRTVSGWLHTATRSRREIMQIYLAAGRGLAAAHAAGLVHRDFKPDNVMVTNDGQVRVMDFGLARQMGEPAAEAKPSLPVSGEVGPTIDSTADLDATADLGSDAVRNISSSSGKYLSVKLTQTGAMLGTPAYMAPEQFAVRPTDARTDQFSFCVALYEALYGGRPFEGETFLALMTSVTAGMVSDAPAKSKVPGWIRRVLLRGLQKDPERRYPSMSALLAALQTDPTVRARRLVAVIATLAFLTASAVAARRVVGTQRAMCRGGTEHLAGLWEPAGAPSTRKAAIHQAFVATGKSYAEAAFRGAARLLDDYVDRWLRMYGDACEATHVRGEQSAEVLDLRMSCLQQRVTSLRALGDVFAQADAKVVENAVAAAGSLPRLESCADVTSLKVVVKPPEDEPTRRRVEALQAERARLVALRDAGKCGEAMRLGAELLPKVRALGYQPLVAETLDASVFPRNECELPKIGLARTMEAYSVAVASRHDEIAAEAATFAAGFAVTTELRQFETARQWLPIARASVARIGGRPLYESWLLMIEFVLRAAEHDWPAMMQKYRESRAAKEKVLGKDNFELFTLDGDLGGILAISGRYEEALTVDVSAVAGLTRLLGPEHPQVGMFTNTEAEVLNLLGRHAEARAAFEQTLSIWHASGADPFYVSYGLTGVGTALLGEGRPTEAVAPLEEALRIRVDEKIDPEHLGETRFALARALWAAPAARDRARTLARQALADYAQVKEPTAPVPDVAAWLRAPSAKL